MIFGIGSDIVKVSRIRALLENKGPAFLAKIFTSSEIAQLSLNIDSSGYIAKRFAAKEAFAKALGTGIGAQVGFHDIEIVKDSKGKPFFKLGKKLDELNKMHNFHLSMSDEKEFAIAYVVIETK